MNSLTVKLPASLEKKLRSPARKRGTSASDVARAAVAKEIKAAAPDCAKLAAPYRGMFSGSADLSSREGYRR